MFGSLAIYVEYKIVFLLRGSLNDLEANAVWLATAIEHHESLRSGFPNLRLIRIMGKDLTGWRYLRSTRRILRKVRCVQIQACEAGDSPQKPPEPLGTVPKSGEDGGR